MKKKVGNRPAVRITKRRPIRRISVTVRPIRWQYNPKRNLRVQIAKFEISVRFLEVYPEVNI